ncbi:MAG: ATP-binding protein [Endomicrobiales bacterium]|nr:ATP-binding protein [Endomicrobiales bacterium]
MKQVLVISGKGGTGKTILTASFAALAKNKVMVDCDVDAADLHLVLHPDIRERFEFRSGKTAKIDAGLCSKCGKCAEVCRFESVKDGFEIDAVACEGCGFCAKVCPAGAITMEENISGEWYVSDTEYGPLVHAKLGIAEENSGKLVAKVRQAAKEMAEKEKRDYVIIDGPPGIGCPVIASMSGVDVAVVVTEPTVSGQHDMERVLEVADHFKIKSCVVINKWDINPEHTAAIERFCGAKGINVAGKIPFSKQICESVVKGVPAVKICAGEPADAITKVWDGVKNGA